MTTQSPHLARLAGCAALLAFAACTGASSGASSGAAEPRPQEGARETVPAAPEVTLENPSPAPAPAVREDRPAPDPEVRTVTEDRPTDPAPASDDASPEPAVATLGAGCFWCVEAVYEQLDGVLSAVSGYMGGTVDNPTYAQVCTKKTGHVEVVQVEFDPEKITYEEILTWFWQLHDPTTRDRQGADVGPQYRSVVFFHSEEQERVARASMAAVQPKFADPIVTDIRPAMAFWVAEQEHQGYYFDNKRQGYCRMVIAPKLDKLGLEK